MMLDWVQCIPPALILAGVIAYARAQSFDRITILLLLLAFGLYYFHFYHTNWTEFAIDPEPHMGYIRFLRDSHRLPLPTDNMGAAARHPPLFYITAALMLQGAELLGLTSPEQFTRNVAMACYAVFIVMSTGLLRFVIKETSMAYYSALLLLLFWPIGATMGGRISCDILLFAGQAGCLFALVRWQADRTPKSLCAPFIWGGVAVLGKNSGVIMIGFAGIAFLMTAWQHRRALHSFIRWDLAAAIVFAGACAAFSYWHGWILRHIEAHGYYWDYLWKMTASFNPFLFIYDTNLGLSQDSFWNMWLHTLIMGGGAIRWASPDLVLVSKVLWLSLLFYAADGLIAARKDLSVLEKAALKLLTAFVILMICAALYLLMRTANPNYTDARYAYPAVIIFTLMHGLVMKHHKEAGRAGAYRIGGLLAVCFTGVTIVLFGAQYSV